MADVNQVPGGNAQGSGAASNVNQNNNDDHANDASREVRDPQALLATHERVLREKKKIQAELETLLSEKKEREEAALKEKGKWEEYAKQKEAEAAKERADRLQLETRVQNAGKLHSVLKHITGTVDDKYRHLVDLDQVVINPETGQPDDVSAQKVARMFEAEHARLIDRKGGPKLPNEAPHGSTASTFATDIAAAKTQQELDAVLKKYGKQ